MLPNKCESGDSYSTYIVGHGSNCFHWVLRTNKNIGSLSFLKNICPLSSFEKNIDPLLFFEKYWSTFIFEKYSSATNFEKIIDPLFVLGCYFLIGRLQQQNSKLFESRSGRGVQHYIYIRFPTPIKLTATI
jgi:hypothetical protein